MVDPKKMVQIGIRGPLAGGDDMNFVNKNGIRVITVDEIRNQPISDFLKTLPKFDDTPTYISYDIDNLDPSCAPGTGTPVPGGLTTYEVQRIFRALEIPNLVGGDVVEIVKSRGSMSSVSSSHRSGVETGAPGRGRTE